MMLWEMFEPSLRDISNRRAIRVSGYTVWLSPHIEKRRLKRGVETNEISKILTRLNRAKHLIRYMEPHERFAVYDPDLGVSLAMMRASSGEDNLLFNTVYRGRPWISDMPVFDVR